MRMQNIEKTVNETQSMSEEQLRDEMQRLIEQILLEKPSPANREEASKKNERV